ncbi:MAG: toxin-antitoxin system YwqK family antitoxin [Alphaproteobacteria bacterium]|jgi:antitoxin component YwqK of YwqJK toxin-antitoxin module
MKKYFNYIVIFLVAIALVLFILRTKTICDDMDAKKIYGILYLLNKKTPFTGRSLCIWDISDKKWYEGYYKDGLKDGIWTFWDRNGQIKSETNYTEGQKHGKKIIYNNKGNRSKEFNCSNDVCLEVVP